MLRKISIETLTAFAFWVIKTISCVVWYFLKTTNVCIEFIISRNLFSHHNSFDSVVILVW